MSVELRHLRSFLVLAEELNFSRAAARLHLAQPALSGQIRTLETQLGCRLFARTTRKVELTPNGLLLLDDAREIVARADAAVSRLKAAARGDRGLLRVGFVAHGAGEIGTEILRRLGEAFPALETELVEAATLEGLQNLVRDREADVAFGWLPVVHDELRFQPLATEGLMVAVGAGGQPLAEGDGLTVSELLTTPIVAPWDDVPFALLRPWLGEVRPQGRREGDPNATGLAECLAVASSGRGVYCVPESVARYYARPDLVFRPVVDAAPSVSVAVWRHDTSSPALASFLAVAREVAPAAD